MWVPSDYGDPTSGLSISQTTVPGHLAPQKSPRTILRIYLTYLRAFGTFGTRSRIRVADQTIAWRLYGTTALGHFTYQILRDADFGTCVPKDQ